MTDLPTIDPHNAVRSHREFDRWYYERRTDWPQELQDAGQRALLTLKTLDQPDAFKSPGFMAASKKDLQDFAAAYAEWKR